MLKHNFLLPAIAASAAFALPTVFISILNCKFYADVCYFNPDAITLKVVLFVCLGLIFLGFAMNSIFFIGCAVYKQSNFEHKCMRYVFSGFSPVVIYLIYYLFSVGKFPEITFGQIKTALEFCLSGLVSGFVFNWVEKRINRNKGQK